MDKKALRQVCWMPNIEINTKLFYQIDNITTKKIEFSAALPMCSVALQVLNYISR